MISKERLLSPVYYVIAGTDVTDGKLKGCMLERGKFGVDQEYCVGYDESDPNGRGKDKKKEEKKKQKKRRRRRRRRRRK